MLALRGHAIGRRTRRKRWFFLERRFDRRGNDEPHHRQQPRCSGCARRQVSMVLPMFVLNNFWGLVTLRASVGRSLPIAMARTCQFAGDHRARRAGAHNDVIVRSAQGGAIGPLHFTDHCHAERRTLGASLSTHSRSALNG